VSRANRSEAGCHPPNGRLGALVSLSCGRYERCVAAEPPSSPEPVREKKPGARLRAAADVPSLAGFPKHVGRAVPGLPWPMNSVSAAGGDLCVFRAALSRCRSLGLAMSGWLILCLWVLVALLLCCRA